MAGPSDPHHSPDDEEVPVLSSHYLSIHSASTGTSRRGTQLQEWLAESPTERPVTDRIHDFSGGYETRRPRCSTTKNEASRQGESVVANDERDDGPRCDICGAKMDRVSLWRSIRLVFGSSRRNRYKCPRCDKALDSALQSFGIL